MIILLLFVIAALALPLADAKLGTSLARRLTDSSSLSNTTEMFAFEMLTTSDHRRLKAIDLVGGSGTPPANRLPLQECEGDCDNDGQVSMNL